MIPGFQLSNAPFLADVPDSFFFPVDASTYAQEVDSTFDMILWISNAFFFAILAAMIIFVVRYRQAKGGRATSRATHHNLLEISWTVLPCFLLVIMFVRGSWGFLNMQTPPEGADVVNVKAFKWGWTMDYGNAAFHPELHVVVNRPTRMVMRSSDVIHAFFVPAFRIKRDIVPGRYNTTWFEATVASKRVSDAELQQALDEAEANNGNFNYEHGFTPDGYTYFDLFCAEYCGRDHSRMKSYVVVHETQEDLDAWLAKIKVRQPGVPLEEHGQKLYNQRGCASCHSIDGTPRVGPTFVNLFGKQEALASGETVLVDENYLRESILDPKAKVVAGLQPVMPSYQGQLTDDDIDSLIAYMKTLSELSPPATAAPAAAGEAAGEGDAAAEPAAADGQPAAGGAAAADDDQADAQPTPATD